MQQTIEQIIDPTSETATRRTRRTAPATQQGLAKLGRRLPLVVAAALLGIVAGYLLTSGPATYKSTALVQLSESTGESTRVKQVAQTVERTALSTPVLQEAADERGTTARDLATRTTAQWETDTDVVLITVRGGDRQGIVEDADAVVASLREFYDKQTRAEIEELSVQGDELLESGALNEESAEAARRSGVGSALAARQGTAAAGWTTVTLLEAADTAVPTGLSAPIAMALGGFVGMVLSAAAALLLPFRRRKVRRASDVPVLLDGVEAVPPGEAGAAETAGRFLESECNDLAIVAVGKVDEQALEFATDVALLLRAHGISASLVDATDSSDAALAAQGGTPRGDDLKAFEFLGRAGRGEARRKHDAQALVVVATARTETLSLLSGQTDVMAVVAVQPRRQRTGPLRTILDQLRHSRPTVALLR